jgi:uncharacterized membrane protein YbhN (UPF0104 family)
MAKVNWAPLFCSLALVVPLFVVKAWRWRLLLSGYGRRISLREAVELYTISAGAGALTPGAIGDFWKSFSPSVAGRAVGLWTSMLDRLYDMAFLVVLGAVVATRWIASHELRGEAAAALVMATAALWVSRGRTLDLLRRFVPAIPLDERTENRHDVAAVGATLVASAIAILRFALLVRALGLPLGWTQVIVAFTLTSGVAALPLSVAGIGTRDLLLLGYLRGHGIPPAEVIALSSLCLLLILWNGAVALCLWLAVPIGFGRTTEEGPRGRDSVGKARANAPTPKFFST